MDFIIKLISLVGAIVTIIGWIRKPATKFYAILALVLAIASAATAEYTLPSIILLIILGIIIFLIYSVKTYANFEEPVVQASILFGKSKKELTILVKEVRKKVKVKTPTELAKGLELIAKKGEDFSNAKELLTVASNLSSGLSNDFLLCIEILIKFKRYFELDNYEAIADKLCVSASNGIQPEDVNQTFDAFNNNCYYSKNITIDEFLASVISLGKSEMRGKKAGSSLAELINGISEISELESYEISKNS